MAFDGSSLELGLIAREEDMWTGFQNIWIVGLVRVRP